MLFFKYFFTIKKRQTNENKKRETKNHNKFVFSNPDISNFLLNFFRIEINRLNKSFSQKNLIPNQIKFLLKLNFLGENNEFDFFKFNFSQHKNHFHSSFKSIFYVFETIFRIHQHF